MSPGNNAGVQAAADAGVRAVMPAFHKWLGAYPVGSPKYKAVLKAVTALSDGFGSEQAESLVPSGILQLAQQAKGGLGESAPPPGAMPPQGGAAPM